VFVCCTWPKDTPGVISVIWLLVGVRLGIPTMCLYLSLYKILLHVKTLLWESIILLLPPPPCKAYPIAILLHDYCAIYAPPTDLSY